MCPKALNIKVVVGRQSVEFDPRYTVTVELLTRSLSLETLISFISFELLLGLFGQVYFT